MIIDLNGPNLWETNEAYARITRDGTLDLNPADPPRDDPPPDYDAADDAAREISEAWERGEITTDELALQALRCIMADVAGGTIPWDVPDYGELHSYVDANCYPLEVLGLFTVAPDDEDDEHNIHVHNAVTTRVQQWLTGGDSDFRAHWERDENFSATDRELAHKNWGIDIRAYLRDMGKPHLDPPRLLPTYVPSPSWCLSRFVRGTIASHEIDLHDTLAVHEVTVEVARNLIHHGWKEVKGYNAYVVWQILLDPEIIPPYAERPPAKYAGR